jgi:hypothetical protein
VVAGGCSPSASADAKWSQCSRKPWPRTRATPHGTPLIGPLSCCFGGTPRGIRTPNRQIRSLPLFVRPCACGPSVPLPSAESGACRPSDVLWSAWWPVVLRQELRQRQPLQSRAPDSCLVLKSDGQRPWACDQRPGTLATAAAMLIRCLPAGGPVAIDTCYRHSARRRRPSRRSSDLVARETRTQPWPAGPNAVPGATATCRSRSSPSAHSSTSPWHWSRTSIQR